MEGIADPLADQILVCTFQAKKRSPTLSDLAQQTVQVDRATEQLDMALLQDRLVSVWWRAEKLENWKVAIFTFF